MTDIITLRGFVANDPKPAITKTGVQTVSFRFGSPLQRWDTSRNAPGTDHMNWFTVQAYRHLAGNLACSLKKGQKIIVVGKIKNRTWERDGQTHLEAEIEAVTVGHDLKHGSANYSRTSDNNPGSAGAYQPGRGPEAGGAGPMESYDGPDDAGEDPYGSDPRDETQTDGSLLMKDDDGNDMTVDRSTGEVSAPA